MSSANDVVDDGVTLVAPPIGSPIPALEGLRVGKALFQTDERFAKDFPGLVPEHGHAVLRMEQHLNILDESAFIELIMLSHTTGTLTQKEVEYRYEQLMKVRRIIAEAKPGMKKLIEEVTERGVANPGSSTTAQAVPVGHKITVVEMNQRLNSIVTEDTLDFFKEAEEAGVLTSETEMRKAVFSLGLDQSGPCEAKHRELYCALVEALRQAGRYEDIQEVLFNDTIQRILERIEKEKEVDEVDFDHSSTSGEHPKNPDLDHAVKTRTGSSVSPPSSPPRHYRIPRKLSSAKRAD